MSKLKITKIGISFGDNDFGMTFHAFLKAIGYFPDFKEETISEIKDKLNEIYNASVLGMYIAGQNRFQYTNGSSMEDHLNEVENYLVKDGNNQKLFYINEEVDQYLENCDGWDNGEFHILEISFQEEPKVYSK
jgi:hypothetical protein